MLSIILHVYFVVNIFLTGVAFDKYDFTKEGFSFKGLSQYIALLFFGTLIGIYITAILPLTDDKESN